MIKYILQRIGFALLTLVIIMFVVYVLTAQFSINPFAEKANGSSAGSEAKQKQRIFRKVIWFFS
ncbi:hypothetical protein ONA24_06550 [Mycoplasmopsis cynos]|uniref:hypothetical protein n=1 Tax=Mycoplasmopsis cynos TaxID=171284 RepID=UPI0024CCF65D|nr:hypothetical protein [Mycoplasmopsis cynos]WAM04575.1 hypothetical protein ONA01_06335 [Mycoplasmopsis cynos]WAM09605.1 hypothetical protein ONA24_06550 [Mycoplasmopsis cynos]